MGKPTTKAWISRVHGVKQRKQLSKIDLIDVYLKYELSAPRINKHFFYKARK
jgi:hypothetical protein